MHPIFSDLPKRVIYILAWLSVGVLIARFLTLGGLADWNTALLFSLPVSVIYGFVASSAYYVCRALPITARGFGSTLALFSLASLFSGGVWLELCTGWNHFAKAMDWWFIDFTQSSQSLLFSAGAGCYLISLLIHDVLIAARRIRQAELDAAKSQLVARDAELQMLRAQINPHFLFNSLNSISALTSIDSTAARAMTIALAQFFRQSLTLSEKNTIPLWQEMELCERFLDVEKIRFGNKLRQAFQVDEQIRCALIPPMLLQPLIENAIKHGIRDLPDGGTISVTATVRDHWLDILVHNPCDEQASDSTGNGLGLSNIKQRLANIYSHQARIQWARTSHAFSVEITLPLKL